MKKIAFPFLELLSLVLKEQCGIRRICCFKSVEQKVVPEFVRTFRNELQLNDQFPGRKSCMQDVLGLRRRLQRLRVTAGSAATRV